MCSVCVFCLLFVVGPLLLVDFVFDVMLLFLCLFSKLCFGFVFISLIGLFFAFVCCFVFSSICFEL